MLLVNRFAQFFFFFFFINLYNLCEYVINIYYIEKKLWVGKVSNLYMYNVYIVYVYQIFVRKDNVKMLILCFNIILKLNINV